LVLVTTLSGTPRNRLVTLGQVFEFWTVGDQQPTKLSDSIRVMTVSAGMGHRLMGWGYALARSTSWRWSTNGYVLQPMSFWATV